MGKGDKKNGNRLKAGERDWKEVREAEMNWSGAEGNMMWI